MKNLLIAIAVLIAATNAAKADNVYDVVNKVNKEINASVTYKSDKPHEDVWRLPVDGTGDCEDYAIAKLKQLKDEGIGGEIYIFNRKGVQHAVAVVGNWVLDNLSNEVYEVNFTPIARVVVDFDRKAAYVTHLGYKKIRKFRIRYILM